VAAVWQAETTEPETTQAATPIAGSPSGDFVDLYRGHYPRLVSALRFAGAPEVQAQDLGQEAFARTFRHWRRVRSGSNPRGYVTTIAFRLLRRHHDLSDSAPAPDADGALPSHEALVVTRVGIEAVLAAMPARRRACASLCLYLDVAVDDAAELLGITPSTVRVQLHRARQDLRAALEQPVTD
jgi:RNA polymerase sigma factor (sigma-70 family)